jgi:DNA-binding FadR family transcriptional regulator
MDSPTLAPRRTKPRNLALDVVDALNERVRNGALAVGAKLPTEAAIMDEFGVSRTVVREALSKLQASGVVQTRHGVGTFVGGRGRGERLSHRARADGNPARRDRRAGAAHRRRDRIRPAWPRCAAPRPTWS